MRRRTSGWRRAWRGLAVLSLLCVTILPGDGQTTPAEELDTLAIDAMADLSAHASGLAADLALDLLSTDLVRAVLESLDTSPRDGNLSFQEILDADLLAVARLVLNQLGLGGMSRGAAGDDAMLEMRLGDFMVGLESYLQLGIANEDLSLIPVVDIQSMTGDPQALLARVPAINRDEEACRQATSKNRGKFFSAKVRCLLACARLAQRGGPPCAPPYSGDTLACIQDVEAKALGGIGSRCGDCPECYADGDCSAYGATLVAGTEAAIDSLAALVLCDDSASPDGLTSAEARCRQAAARAVAKFVDAKAKCLARCRKSLVKGRTEGVCEPGVTGGMRDPKTAGCIAKAEEKADAALARRCADPPDCGAQAFQGLVSGAEAFVDAFDGRIFCGS